MYYEDGYSTVQTSDTRSATSAGGLLRGIFAIAGLYLLSGLCYAAFLYATADANNDGKLTVAELEAAAKESTWGRIFSPFVDVMKSIIKDSESEA